MLHEIDLSRVDLNLLVLFETVLRERHVGRAAARLSLSPSAVSHGLGRLRRLLDDPLFLRNPKGVVPTAAAEALAEPVAEILRRVRQVVAGSGRFDPATSTRRFVIGAPDGISTVILMPLLAEIGRVAQGVDLALRQVLHPFDATLAELDARTLDVAILPTDAIPARFAARPAYAEDFVLALRQGHPLGLTPTPAAYCAASHVLVSQSGDPLGYVDAVLAEQGLHRRVALTVPNFLLALAVVGETDFVAALPRQLVAAHGERFGVVAAEVPLKLRRFPVQAVVPKVALLDAGIAWLLALIEHGGSLHRAREDRSTCCDAARTARKVPAAPPTYASCARSLAQNWSSTPRTCSRRRSRQPR
jgi:DNA-binding transcriptional LysR family regulator